MTPVGVTQSHSHYSLLGFGTRLNRMNSNSALCSLKRILINNTEVSKQKRFLNPPLSFSPPVPGAAPQNLTVEVLNSKVSRCRVPAVYKKPEPNTTAAQTKQLPWVLPCKLTSVSTLRTNRTEQHICTQPPSCHKALAPQSLFPGTFPLLYKLFIRTIDIFLPCVDDRSRPVAVVV